MNEIPTANEYEFVILRIYFALGFLLLPDFNGIRDSIDNGTRELFKLNLLDEEGDVDWLEAQMDQIKQMGIENYLSKQI